MSSLAVNLLRGDVVGRADGQPLLGLGPGPILRFAGHAQVGQLGDAVQGQDDVARLHVAVDQAAAMGVLQGLGDLQGDLDRFLLRVDFALFQLLP